MTRSILKNVVRMLDESNLDDVLAGFGVRRRSGVGDAVSTFGLFAAGIAIGAAAGLLLAPKSGQEMRDDLMAKVNSFSEEIGNKVQSAMNKGERYNPPS